MKTDQRPLGWLNNDFNDTLRMIIPVVMRFNGGKHGGAGVDSFSCNRGDTTV